MLKLVGKRLLTIVRSNKVYLNLCLVYVFYMGGSRGGRGPQKNNKNIVFLSNTGSDPLKHHKATKPTSNLGHHQHVSETPFKWRFADGPMMAHEYWYFDLFSLIN